MPRRFDKTVRDEWRDRMAGKSHTCEACCDGNCKDCSGTCDCSKCHKGSNASVLDALESKTGAYLYDLEGTTPPPDRLQGEGVQEGPDLLDRHQKVRKYIDALQDPAHRAYAERFYHNTIRNGLPESEPIVPVRNALLAIMHGQGALEPNDSWETDASPSSHWGAIAVEGEGVQVSKNMRTAAGQWQLGEGGRGWNPNPPEICRACEQGNIIGGICDHCHTPVQDQSRSEWSPAQGDQKTICPRCQGQGCGDCKGTGFVALPAHIFGHLRYEAEASMPPEGMSYQQKETALPYNPEAYESQVNDMHPAAQYTYQRAVAQGADPQSAYQMAQEKQGEMGKRTQEGQNTEGIQIPVINTSYHGDSAGFVSGAVIKRVSHLL